MAYSDQGAAPAFMLPGMEWITGQAGMNGRSWLIQSRANYTGGMDDASY
jgi:hypothetical protein